MTKAEIEAEYARRRARYPGQPDWGWSFMYVPESTAGTGKAVLIGLNPGGRQVGEPGQWDYTTGVNAYVDERWRAEPGKMPLQKQVQALFTAAGLSGGEVFSANLVPFRSPRWNDLEGREEALSWSREQLWRPLLASSPARIFFSLGKRAGREMAAMLGADHVQDHPSGWGQQTVEDYRTEDGRVVLAIPHLSRFALFDRDGGLVERTVIAASASAFGR